MQRAQLSKLFTVALIKDNSSINEIAECYNNKLEKHSVLEDLSHLYGSAILENTKKEKGNADL